MNKRTGGGRKTDSAELRAARYDGAVIILPPPLRAAARSLSLEERARAEEIRIRAGRPLCVVMPEGERLCSKETVSSSHLDALLEIATGASLHASREQLRGGFLTVRGGYRVGICGSAIVRDGEVRGFSAVSSAAIRISREVRGAGRDVLMRILRAGGIGSTLIISPPGGGKTTLLRDMVRLISDGDAGAGVRAMRVALADERGEIAAMCGGAAQMDVGRHTDVLDACPKAAAVMMLLRAMNPEVIALDEITAPEDAEAITRARNCGVKLIATAHAESVADLETRPLYRALLADGVFENIVSIKRAGGGRVYEHIRRDAF